MKLTALLIFSGLMTVSASIYSQATKLTLDLDGVSILEVIKTIEAQSEYVFIYKNELIDPNRKVNVNIKSSTVDVILDKILRDSGIKYEIIKKQIILTHDHSIPARKIESVPGDSEQPKKKEISGTVKDQNGLSLPGVTVVIKGSTTGTITDDSGNFILSYIGDAEILSFSFIGMKTQEVKIGNKTNFSILMSEETVGVGEVVVVGYGTQKKATITGAVSSIGNSQLLQSPQANISNALVGRMSGLLSVQRSGQPGEDQSILRIRGIGTFTGSQDPLIMVDGIETDNYNNIDPNEIESISILKDASATAVYGVRGANGVLIITTKRGKDGKPQVSYSAQYATSRFTNIRHSMNAYDYATSYNKAQAYDGYISGGYTPAFSEEAIAHYKSHDDPILYPDVDWFAYMFDKNSGQKQHNLNIQGGTDKVKYFVSLGYFDQDGLINNTDLVKDYDAQIRYKRYNIRANFDFNITKRLSANINVSSQIENRSGTAAPIDRIFEACWATNPTNNPLLSDTGGKFVILDNALTPMNPLAYMFRDGGLKKDYRNYLNSSLRFNYQLDFITKGLSSHATISYNNYNSQVITYNYTFIRYRVNRLTDNSVVYIPQSDPTPFTFSEEFGKNRKTYSEIGLDYSRKFGNHNLGGLLLYNQSKRYDPNYLYQVPNGYQGLVGRVTYDFKTRYLAEVNIGYNGTENFAIGKRFGFFPAYSLGWVASEEPFFPKNDYLTYLKIRGSYGMVGNDQLGNILISTGTGKRFLYLPASYSYTDMSKGGFYYFGEDGSNQQGYQGSLEGPLGNQGLTWERAEKFNIGTEAIFWKDKLKASFDYFNENRDNILATKNTIPVIVAATLPAYNLGKMSNSGFETEIAFNSNIKKFNYWLKANFTYAHNLIKFKDEVEKPFSYQYETGQRYGQFFGLVAEGLYNTWEEVNDVNRPVYGWQNNKIQPGDIKYKDVNGDGKINSDDMVPIGYSDFPEKVFGLSFGGEFKGFDFSVLFQGAGNVSVEYSRRYVQPFGNGTNAPDYMVESWSQERYDTGQKISFPHLSQGLTFNDANYQPSTFWTKDASYIRLKNAEIGYTIPAPLLKRVGINYMRLYINGSNLLTWDSLLPGADPESLAATKTNSDPYPVTRTINFGFNVKF